MIFGALAAAITLIIFGYQFGFENYPQLFPIKTVVAIMFFIGAGGIVIYACARTLPKLKHCWGEFKNLQ
jgi:Co/Zn/Cd efflux system component